MNLESKLKEVRLRQSSEANSLEISFAKITSEFTQKNRFLILHSNVKYKSKDFTYDAVLPTVKIPYEDPSFGFLINGMLSSATGVYQRSPGVILDVDTRNSVNGRIETLRADIISAHNARMSVRYYQEGIVVTISRNGVDTHIPAGVFLKAISEVPYQMILDEFAVAPQELLNSFVTTIPSKRINFSRAAVYTREGDMEPSVAECIDKVCSAINKYGGKKNTGTEAPNYAPQWQRDRIANYLSNLQFKTREKMEATLSLAARAKKCAVQYDVSLPIFLEDGSVGEFKLHAGEFIDDAKSSELIKYNITQLHVLRIQSVEGETKKALLQEASAMVFRVKGYKLAEDLEECGLSAGTLIGDAELDAINATDTLRLDVETPDGRQTFYRTDEKVTLGDFVNIINYLCTNDITDTSSQAVYDIANRVVIGYDKQVMIEVEHVYNDIASAIMGSESLSKLIEALPRLPYNRLTQALKDPNKKEIEQAEITNILAAAIANDRSSALIAEATKPMMAVQKGQYGRFDSLHAPESEKIGAVQQMTVMAKLNSNTNEVETPYEVIENGVPTGRIEMVSASQEVGKYIVEWNNNLETPIVFARRDDETTTVRREQVSYRDPNPFVDMSVSRATIPFPEFSQPKRAMMAAKMGGQAVPLLNPERAMVSTGADTEIPCMYYTARQILQSTGQQIVEGQKLKVVNSEWGMMVTYEMLYNGTMFNFTVPFTPTSKDTLYNFNLVAKPQYLYELDDIVLCNQSCDISPKEFWKREQQGALPYVKDCTKPGLALGVNLLVGYKTYMSSTVDDAVVISDELVTEGTLSNIQIMHYDYECNVGEEIDLVAGPKLHEVVHNNEPVIVFKRMKKSLSKVHTVNAKQAGEVIRIDISNKGKKIEVWVATYHNAIEGDKVAGRYGNKSVIAKIVPKEQMPFDPETGETLQIICSPLGIPSRMNLGQVLEITLGAAMQVEGKTASVTPFYEGIKGDIQKEYETQGLAPKRLFLPEYGKYSERQIMVGVLYFMKLEQMSNLKWSACGYPTNVDAVFGQPVSSLNSRKGQSISEMETWALIASGAKKQLNTYFTLGSDDANTRKEYFDMLSANDENEFPWDESLEGFAQHNVRNISALVTQVMFRTAGLDIEVGDDNRYHISPLNMDDIPVTISLNKLKGHLENVGPDRWTKIPLKKPCINPFWIFNFPLSILLGVESVRALVNKTRLLSTLNKKVCKPSEVPEFQRKFYLTGIEACIFLLQETTIDECIARLKKYASSGDTTQVITIDDSRSVEENLDLYGIVPEHSDLMSFLYRMKEAGKQPSDLIMNYLPVLPGVFRQADKTAGRDRENEFQNHTIRIAEAATSEEIFNALRAYIGGGSERTEENSIRRYFFGQGSSNDDHGRVREKIMSKRIGFSGRTVIMPMADPHVSPFFVGLPWRVVLTEMSRMITLRVENHLEEICDSFACGSEMKVKVLSLPLRSLEGIVLSLAEFDEKWLNKYIKCPSTRWAYEFYLALRRFVKHIVEGDVRQDGAILYNGEYVYPEDLPEGATIDAFVVSFGRQPTLHKKSLRTYFVILVDGFSTHIHPINCKGYNADFDGDQMYNVQIMAEAKLESFKTTSIVQDLISQKSGGYTLELEQDIALGLYCATTLKDNVDRYTDDSLGIYTYDSVAKMEFDMLYGDLHYWSLVYLTVNGNDYFSTAGRILVNSKLKTGLTDMPYSDKNGLFYQVYGKDAKAPAGLKSLAYDAIWCVTGLKSKGHENTKNVMDILLDIYNGLGARESVMTAHRLYEAGLTASDIYSVSMDMRDLSVDIDIDKMLVEPKQRVEELNNLYQMGLITEEERKRSAVRIWDDTKKSSQKQIIAAMDPKSNMYYMLYSGARGKPDQVMQAVGFIGNISKSEQADIEYPILSGYGNGLSAFDLMQTRQSARIGVVSTQAGTKDTGYATRQSVYMMSGLEIKEKDCGISAHLTEIVYGDGGINKALREELLGDFVVEVDEGFDILRPVLARTGFMITDEVLDLIESAGIKSIKLIDREVTFNHAISAEERERLKGMYSYALPFTDEDMQLTDATVDWIEFHGLQEVVAFEQDEKDAGTWFKGEAYLPVQYDCMDRQFYTVDDAGKEHTVDEEVIFLSIVSENSERYKYYRNLLTSEGRMTIKALSHLTKKFVRRLVLVNEQGIETVVHIRYKLSKLFTKLAIGRFGYGLPFLDAEKAVTNDTLDEIERVQLETVALRTSLTCWSNGGVCAMCYGKNTHSGHITEVGTNLGITAAQTMCQPLSQATLNVQHAGGKRTGLNSGLAYYRKMLQGDLLTQRTKHLAESYAPVEGYIRRSPTNPSLVQIVDEEGAVLHSELTDDGSRISVLDGAFVDKDDTIISGLARLSRFCSRDVAPSALKTRMLLIQEYDKVFADLDVSPKNYEILARAQTSECRLAVTSSMPRERDTGDECREPTYNYQLVVSSQLETVKRYSGIACIAFERAYSMMTMLVLSREGVPLGSALGNIMTGTPIDSNVATCIPKRPYSKSMSGQSVNSQLESYLLDMRHSKKDAEGINKIQTEPKMLGNAASADKLFELLDSSDGRNLLDSGVLATEGADEKLGIGIQLPSATARIDSALGAGESHVETADRASVLMLGGGEPDEGIDIANAGIIETDIVELPSGSIIEAEEIVDCESVEVDDYSMDAVTSEPEAGEGVAEFSNEEVLQPPRNIDDDNNSSDDLDTANSMNLFGE